MLNVNVAGLSSRTQCMALLSKSVMVHCIMAKLHIILKCLKPIVPIAAVALLTSKLDLVLSSRRDVNFF